MLLSTPFCPFQWLPENWPELWLWLLVFKGTVNLWMGVGQVKHNEACAS